MKSLTLQEILDAIPQVNPKRDYWLVRTDGGDYYDDFLQNNFIAIGWNKLTLSEIKEIHGGTESGIYNLRERAAKKYPDESHPGHIASQLDKFIYKIKKGDIVIIPSYSSSTITFGEVTANLTYDGESYENENYSACPFHKRKRVKWLKTQNRSSLESKLYGLMYSRHTITEATEYADDIDKLLNSFFIKGDQAHLVLGVQSTGHIKAKDLFQMGSVTLELLDEFSKEENLTYNSNEFNVKLNVQSPGLIELTGPDMGGVVLLGLIVVGIVGGGFSVKWGKFDLGLKTEGIIEKIRKFLVTKGNIEAKRKLIEKNAEHLKIKEPKDLVDVLERLDKK